MPVNIIWSLTAGGVAVTTTIDHGNCANGSNTTIKEIYLRHDGLNSITAAGLYIRQFSGTYVGSFTANADINEIIGWADAVTSAGFGGVHCNLLATTSYPSSGWPLYDDKSPTGGFAHRTGVGDSEANAFLLPTSTDCGVAGVITSGETTVRFKMRIGIPADELIIGVRQFDQVLRYTYTT
jgi:hypothetical protein